MGIFIDSTGISSEIFFEIQGKELPPQTKGFLSFLDDLLQRPLLGLPLALRLSDTTSFCEKPSESLWCCWRRPPMGKPVSVKEEEEMFIMCDNWVALGQQEVRSKGHVCPALLPVLNE